MKIILKIILIILVAKGIDKCNLNQSLYNYLARTYSRGGTLKQVWIFY